ncbi:unnamed protein product [Prorocentrum cordatum]|uniref:C3H1-type domain-containing protein n=1 Tax=Prorocentrum cordatum TaxID=2364126 RepID=A0ABN9VGF1_9DINO|nr:unnamed protein product [Polarella glacialis]
MVCSAAAAGRDLASVAAAASGGSRSTGTRTDSRRRRSVQRAGRRAGRQAGRQEGRKAGRQAVREPEQGGAARAASRGASSGSPQFWNGRHSDSGAAPGMSADPGAPGAALEMPGEGGAEGSHVAPYKNSFLELVHVEPHLRRAQSDSDLWSSSGGCPSRPEDDASLVAGRGRLPGRAGAASTSMQELLAGGADGRSSPGGSADEDGHRRPAGTAATAAPAPAREPTRTDKHAGWQVNDRTAGSGLEGRGKKDDGQEELAKLESSRGAATHATGNCKPCIYHNASSGCARGVSCKFCHEPHERKQRARPSKATRLQCKKLAENFGTAKGQPDTEANPGPLALVSDTYLATMGIMCAAERKYMRSILSARSRQSSGQQATAPCGRTVSA